MDATTACTISEDDMKTTEVTYVHVGQQLAASVERARKETLSGKIPDVDLVRSVVCGA